ncbi:MAG: hypothetical protein H7A45_10285 [Verrucomicrobiales bacterium]|nr:hypothetical protein [Verrucomicrobiales bacterium]MCP5528213.1 hypothetical protein [Verrucomicrobiales bacterium]
MLAKPTAKRWTPRSPARIDAAILVGLLVAISVGHGQNLPDYELAPIHYSTTEPDNPVATLRARLAAGEAVLSGGREKQTLAQCLSLLDVSPASQVLLFSRTSLQRRLIHPDHPRALYFSDDCYVGWVPGGLMEVAHSDPQLGLVFYRLDARQADQTARLERDDECLSCHAGPLTRGWPALMVRSVYPDATGEPILRAGSFLIEHDTPISNRWGGWYVTGSTGSIPHLGNLTFDEPAETTQALPQAREETADPARRFPTETYLRATSDVLALLVLEHQVGMHNRLAEGSLRTRKWMHYQQSLQTELGEPVSEQPTGTALRVVQNEARRIVRHLLFAEEAALPPEGIQGDPAFVEAFRANRREDARARSLKDFDLQTRLFRWRCSYLIYSQAFDGLPPVLKAAVYDRLDEVLGSEAPPPEFTYLDRQEREDIRTILRATKPELAARWPAASPAERPRR